MRCCVLRLLLLLSPAIAGCASSEVGMDPDLTFKAACAARPSTQAVSAVERKMFAAGFDVLDTATIAQERQVSYPYPVEVEAFDKAGHYLSLLSLGTDVVPRPDGSPFVIHVGLYTHPPTRRDAALEQRIVAWMTEDLRCSARDVARHENGPAALPTYDSTTKNLRDRFDEARRTGAGPDALLVH